jgi:lipid II:glycine glycyltransferase (peptidoglycan interpeptide bridge formation enzyme)
MDNHWNSMIFHLPNPHFLQTFEWGQVKARVGWNPYYAVWFSDGSNSIFSEPPGKQLKAPVAACLILQRSLPLRGFGLGLSILYAPKAPLLDWTNAPLRNRVLNDLQMFAKKLGAIFLKIDPDAILGRGVPGTDGALAEQGGVQLQEELARRGWVYSADQIQFRNTVWIDLQASEAELLASMKQKTRYNIRLAEKKGVVIRLGTLDDLPMLYRMYAETSVRDGFVIRDENYYRTVWETFMQPVMSLHQPVAVPLIAEVEGEPVASLFLFMFASHAWYVYGMSRDLHREKMPTYLLQWAAIKHTRAAGCTIYDLWGAPEKFDESDSMWGVYRFKEGLGGQVVRTLGAWDYAPGKFRYRLYSEVIPRLLDVMRLRGRSRTRQGLGG